MMSDSLSRHAGREKGLTANIEIQSCINNKAPFVIRLLFHSKV